MMWRALTSVDVLSSKSDRILLPVRSVSRPTAWHHSKVPVEPVETDRLKSYLFRARVARRAGPNQSGLSRYVARGPPDADSIGQVDLSL